mmetsp:Transcript_2891/g.8109  ORF Transcript_2891/g.8109 Transcript_2891/m.8109 type:complete len:386 (-) Transcript_2891:86-1243(-)
MIVVCSVAHTHAHGGTQCMHPSDRKHTQCDTKFIRWCLFSSTKESFLLGRWRFLCLGRSRGSVDLGRGCERLLAGSERLDAPHAFAGLDALRCGRGAERLPLVEHLLPLEQGQLALQPLQLVLLDLQLLLLALHVAGDALLRLAAHLADDLFVLAVPFLLRVPDGALHVVLDHLSALGPRAVLRQVQRQPVLDGHLADGLRKALEQQQQHVVGGAEAEGVVQRQHVLVVGAAHALGVDVDELLYDGVRGQEGDGGMQRQLAPPHVALVVQRRHPCLGLLLRAGLLVGEHVEDRVAVPRVCLQEVQHLLPLALFDAVVQLGDLGVVVDLQNLLLGGARDGGVILQPLVVPDHGLAAQVPILHHHAVAVAVVVIAVRCVVLQAVGLW